MGANYANMQPSDGYTFLLGTQSLYIQDLMGQMGFDFWNTFECESVLVHSINMLAASRVQMDKYGIKTFSDLQAYAAEHPGQVSVAMQSAAKTPPGRDSSKTPPILGGTMSMWKAAGQNCCKC
ncbi:MAG: hypothetical protein IJI25_05625 [Eubacterium sp.]|nr:hypothetical protein [Eubacterium sp.]